MLIIFIDTVTITRYKIKAKQTHAQKTTHKNTHLTMIAS